MLRRGRRGRNDGVSPTGTYTDVRFSPRAGGYHQLAWTVTIRTDPSPDGYFWAHQFGFGGGEQGYCGLQTHNAELGGKIAIFSVWSALGADGPEHAGRFGGEGTGFTARIRYEWQVDVPYRLTVERTASDDAGAWWRAQVADPTTEVVATVGSILVPAQWDGLAATSVMWSERYAGPLRTCADIRHSVVELTDPTADGTTALGFHHHLAVPETCPNSRIDALASGGRHEMGVPMGPPG
jgi:hypothetical protein